MSAVPIAQQDPVANLTARLGGDIRWARERVDDLIQALSKIDATSSDLAKWGVTVDIDLGPVGNAARAARQTVEEHKTGHTKTFQLPRP